MVGLQSRQYYLKRSQAILKSRKAFRAFRAPYCSYEIGYDSLVLGRNVPFGVGRIDRMWYTLENREFVSKDRTALWEIGNLPEEHHDAVGVAVDVYLEKRADQIKGYVPSARACIDWTVQKIGRIR